MPRRCVGTVVAMRVAAVVGTVLLSVLTLFQLALAAGAPWGRAAYGGMWPGVLPRGIRINSAVFGVVLYPLAILYVLDAAGIRETAWLLAPSVVLWVLAGFFAIGTVMNAISRSPVERWWASVSLGLAVCCAVLALA